MKPQPHTESTNGPSLAATGYAVGLPDTQGGMCWLAGYESDPTRYYTPSCALIFKTQVHAVAAIVRARKTHPGREREYRIVPVAEMARHNRPKLTHSRPEDNAMTQENSLPPKTPAEAQDGAAVGFSAWLGPLRDQLRVQGEHGNWNCNEYMLGMFNGLECALATLEHREPKYRRKPDSGWLDDRIPPGFVPTVCDGPNKDYTTPVV